MVADQALVADDSSTPETRERESWEPTKIWTSLGVKPVAALMENC